MKRKQYLAGVLILSAFSLLASHTAHAKSATCTADIFYITGVMRGPDGVRHTIRADFPGARVSKRASGGLIARRVLSAACRAAVQEGFRRTLAGLTSNSIGQTLCRNYVITGERRPANEQLPRGSGVFVQATTLVVSTSQDRDISDYGGLPTADIDCGAALASADGTDRDYCNQFTNAIWPFIRTMHRMPCSGPLYGEFGLGATTNTVHNWCMRNRVRSFTTLRTIISNTFSCARNHLQTLGNIQAGQRANFCTGLSSWVHHMDQLWADMEVLRSYQRYPGTFGATCVWHNGARRVRSESEVRQACMNNEGIDHLNRKQGSLTPWRDLVVKTQGRFYTACGPNSLLLSCSTAYKQASGLLTNMDNCRHYTMFANGWIFTPDRQR